MQVTVAAVDGIVCVDLVGDLDARSAQEALQGILGALREGRPVVLNLAGVAYVSSAGLRVLLMAHRRALVEGVEIILTGLTQSLRIALSVTGLLHIFRTAESPERGAEMLRQK